MSIPPSIFTSLAHPSRAILRRLCITASLGIAASGLAQSVMVTDPTLQLAPRVVQQTTQIDSPLAPDYKQAVSGTPFEFGELRIFPSLQARYMHATGLPVGTGASVDSDITTVTPGITAELGQHWILNYSPSWVNYTAKSMSDSVNQSFLLNGATTTASEWSLKLAEGFQSSNDTIAETAQQTKQNTWSTSLSADHKLGQRSSYEGTASMVDHYGK